MKVAEMTVEELEKALMETATDIAKIKTQIAHAKQEAALNGSYSDPKWYKSINHALRMRGIEHQKLQMELGIKRRKARGKANASFENRFITNAKKILPSDVFENIFNATKSEQL